MAPTLYGQAVTVGAVSTGALILFMAKTDMEPRQGGRFHIWHILGRERCLFATYALRKTVLSSARTARLNGLRGFGPRSRVRDIFGSGNHYSAVLNGSANGYTCGAWLVTHRTVLQTKSVSHMIRRRSTQQDTKTPVAKGRGFEINGG